VPEVYNICFRIKTSLCAETEQWWSACKLFGSWSGGRYIYWKSCWLQSKQLA